LTNLIGGLQPTFDLSERLEVIGLIISIQPTNQALVTTISG